MAILALREYESIRAGDRADFANRIVTAAQYAALERVSESCYKRFGVRVLEYGPGRSLVAQNYVGVLNIGRDQIEILPKIDGPDSTLRKNFMRMLAVALGIDLHGGEASAVQHSQDSILEFVITLFCTALWRALRGGLLRQYVRRRDDISTLKGRFLLSQHLQRNVARPDRVTCEFDEFTEDNAVNQILRAALQILRRVAQSAGNQSRIAELLFCFFDVADVPPAKLAWHVAATNRHSARYQPLLAMARLIIDGRSPDVVSGAHAGFALLFDMNELFELYIGAIVRKVAHGNGIKVHLQGPSLHLARHADDCPVFNLKPDIVIKRDNQVTCILDTKWKRLKPDKPHDGVSSADIYQMHAYSSRYDAYDVILLYPHHAALGELKTRRSQYWLSDSNGKPRRHGIAVSTVDLANLDTVPAQLACVMASATNRAAPLA
jgi:5-methylcytosine-specific restriction enzyme subunit McrC